MSKHKNILPCLFMPYRLAASAALALALTLLAACNGAPAIKGASPIVTTAPAIVTANPSQPPTSLTVLRYSGFVEQNRVAPFQMTSQDAAKVAQLYQAARALPTLIGNPGCPQDYDIGYELSFMHGNALVLQVALSGGCPRASLSDPFDCRTWTPAFTAQVAATLGIAVTTLEPPPPNGLLNTADPGGPFAQADPTPPLLTPNSCFPPRR